LNYFARGESEPILACMMNDENQKFGCLRRAASRGGRRAPTRIALVGLPRRENYPPFRLARVELNRASLKQWMN
jgi:hypothetical protein